MIPVQEMKEGMEKNADILLEIGKAIYNHPRITLGLLGSAALASWLTRASGQIQPIHQMFKEENKQNLYERQNRTLDEMLKFQKEQASKSSGTYKGKKDRKIDFPLT